MERLSLELALVNFLLYLQFAIFYGSLTCNAASTPRASDQALPAECQALDQLIQTIQQQDGLHCEKSSQCTKLTCLGDFLGTKLNCSITLHHCTAPVSVEVSLHSPTDWHHNFTDGDSATIPIPSPVYEGSEVVLKVYLKKHESPPPSETYVNISITWAITFPLPGLGIKETLPAETVVDNAQIPVADCGPVPPSSTSSTTTTTNTPHTGGKVKTCDFSAIADGCEPGVEVCKQVSSRLAKCVCWSGLVRSEVSGRCERQTTPPAPHTSQHQASDAPSTLTPPPRTTTTPHPAGNATSHLQQASDGGGSKKSIILAVSISASVLVVVALSAALLYFFVIRKRIYRRLSQADGGTDRVMLMTDDNDDDDDDAAGAL